MQMDTAIQLPLGAKPIAGRVGALIREIDLADPLSEDGVQYLHWLLAERGVVIFTDQELDVAGHLAFARQLGEIRMPPDYFPTLRDQGHPEIGILVSRPGQGNGSDVWHADVTWSPRPPRYSILHMQVGPEAGGDTMWASLLAAYERLSPPMRLFLQQLTAEHRIEQGTGTNDIERSAQHPVVHRHPVSGRLALSVSPAFAKRILELTETESSAVLDMLFDQILRPESICRWHWNPGDVGIWDNRVVLHYGINDYGDAPRIIHRIEIEGDALIPATRSVSAVQTKCVPP